MDILTLAHMNAVSAGLGAVSFLEQEIRELDEVVDFFNYLVEYCIDDDALLDKISMVFDESIELDESNISVLVNHIAENDDLLEITKIINVKKPNAIKRVSNLIKKGRKKGYTKVLARAAKRTLLKPKRVGQTLYNLHRHNRLTPKSKNPLRKAQRWVQKQLNKVFRKVGNKKFSYGAIKS